MDDLKKDKYKQFQTKSKANVPKKNNNEYSGGENKRANEHNPDYRKDRDSVAARGWSVSQQPSKIKSKARKGRMEDFTKKVFKDVETKLGRPVKFEAGDSVPSGTNTHMPKWGKRTDGSSGPC